MKTLLSIALLTVAAIFSGGVDARENATRDNDEEVKVKVKGATVIVRDKSKPVRRALEEQYARIAEAQKNEDIDALRALRTPDFTVKLPNGETWNLEQSLDYSRRGFEQVREVLSMSNTIETLNVNGDEAVAVVRQQWSRMQMMKGKLRRVDTSAVQRETWLSTGDGWRLKLIDDIRPGIWIVDGKRVDPTKPYDPEAAPYDPEDDAPRR